MGIQDIVAAEERVPVKVSDYYKLVRAQAERDIMLNAVKCDVPYIYIREMMTGFEERPRLDRYGVAGYRQRRK